MSSCHTIQEDPRILETENKILLMGNPNVGKSVFFTELTGIHAISSNYTGTTVSYLEGDLVLDGTKYTLIDVPGIYSMTASSEAEAVAVRFMESGALAVICVLDASNLERNLRLGLDLQKYGIPMVYALNLMDVAERHGIEIDVDLLQKELGWPVIPTVVVKQQGLDELKCSLQSVLEKSSQEKARNQKLDFDSRARAREITRKVRKIKNVNLSRLDRLGESMMKPFPGIPLALLIMILSIGVVVGAGKALRAAVLLPLVNQVLVPFFRTLFTSFIPEGMLLNILVGEYGVFVISFEWIIALILPYVFLFYVVFTFLEDSGYLPRISVLFDNVMRKLGIQGGSLINIVMGYGCAVPAIIGSRAASSRKERLLISTAVCFAVPCISQTGALISLLGSYSFGLVAVMILFSLVIMVIATLTAGRLIKGEVAPLIIEVPNLLIPEPKAYGRKLLIRMKHFVYDAELPMMISIVIAALLKETGLLDTIAVYAEPLVRNWLGLPSEAVIALILGIVRREMSVAPLLALNLTPLQAFVGATVGLLYLPCLSVFGILTKEFNVKVAVVISTGTIFSALFFGGLINQVAQLFT
ncbi:MAG TPA: ferrous iron transporter B [Firmicutes bacterium]|nr:ferrous iron transporter B [Bacillota bacterium]